MTKKDTVIKKAEGDPMLLIIEELKEQTKILREMKHILDSMWRERRPE